jgi:hypothetical protein
MNVVCQAVGPYSVAYGRAFLSLMPNGRRFFGANGAAESALPAIAFRRIDCWLKPPRERRCAIVPSPATNNGSPDHGLPLSSTETERTS